MHLHEVEIRDNLAQYLQEQSKGVRGDGKPWLAFDFCGLEIVVKKTELGYSVTEAWRCVREPFSLTRLTAQEAVGHISAYCAQ
jgi:hypothetical protein